MEMKFLIDGIEHTGSVDDNGYVSVTFTKNTRDDIEVIPLESCGGVTFVDDIQLEKGDTVTPYENPALVQGAATGLIKDIRALQYSIHDPEIGLTSRFAQMAQGFEQEVVDLIGGYSRQGQTINGLFTDVYSPDGRVSQTIQTVDGFKQTVDDLEAGTGTAFEQLSNGFRQRIDEYLVDSTKFSQVESSVSAIEQTVGDPDSLATSLLTSDLWRTEVTNLTQQSVADELTQEYETITSKVNVVNDGGDINYGEVSGEGKYFYFNNDDGVVERTLFSNTTYTLAFSTQTGDNNGNLFTLEVRPYGETEWKPVTTEQMVSGKQKTTITFRNGVFASSVSDYRLVINNVNGVNVPYIWGFRIYEEVEVEVPIESENIGAISSQITQLYNMINLSILGQDGAMSRIAMGEEGIQIDGKLLHITAKTFIDDAVIRSAMIDTLDAGKITTGELNAANVSIVNLDVNNLTGNAFNFIRGAFNSYSSRVNITGDGLDIIRLDGSRVIELDSQGIGITGQSGKKMGRIGHLADGGYGEETVAVGGAYNTDLLIAYQETSGNTYTPAIKVAKNTGSISMSEPTTFSRTVYMNSLFYLGTMRMSGGTGSVGGVPTANLSFPSTGGQLRVANGDLYIRSSSGDYYSFVTLWNKAFSS